MKKRTSALRIEAEEEEALAKAKQVVEQGRIRISKKRIRRVEKETKEEDDVCMESKCVKKEGPRRNCSGSQTPADNLSSREARKMASWMKAFEQMDQDSKRREQLETSLGAHFERIKNIPEAPTFHPSREEFSDTFRYIRHVANTTQHKYGIVKIIPPDDWSPPFAFPFGPNKTFTVKRQVLSQRVYNEEKTQALGAQISSIIDQPQAISTFLELNKKFEALAERRWTNRRQGIPDNAEIDFVRSNPDDAQVLNQFGVDFLPSEDLPTKNKSRRPPKTKKSSPPKASSAAAASVDIDMSVEAPESDTKSDAQSESEWRESFQQRIQPVSNEFLDPLWVENQYWYWLARIPRGSPNLTFYASDVEASAFRPTPPELLSSSSPASSSSSGLSIPQWHPANFRYAPLNILSHIRESVPGVNEPMLYIAMLFSTFCWHVEDNNLYSISYNHCGTPKTWYGVSGADADRFEALCKEKIFPRHYAAEADLMSLKTSMFSPLYLVDAGIPVHRILHRPKEIVITFPRGYHSGFSHGFSCAESVNFALDDWWPWCELSLRRYRKINRLSVINQEELLLRRVKWYSEQSQEPPAPQLIQYFESFYAELLSLLEQVRCASIPLVFPRRGVASDISVYCRECNHSCYAAVLTCGCCPDEVMCLRHIQQHTNCQPGRPRCEVYVDLDQIGASLVFLKNVANVMS